MGRVRFGTESKTEDDTNDSELQHGGPHMVEVLNSSQPGSERKGERPQTDSPTFWIWTGNGILDAPTPGFGRKDATSPMLKIGIGVCR